MANREKGEVDLKVGPETYTICIDLNAMALVESHFSTPDRDVTFYEVFGRLRTGGVRYIRAIIWAGLQKHHPGFSIEAVGSLIQKAGGLSTFGDKLHAACAEAGLVTIPDKADLKELGVNANGERPQTAQAGRGARSVSRRVPSA